ALPIYRGRRRRGPYRRRKPWIRGNGSVDWDELLTIAFEVGWTQEQFWNSTPHELSLAAEAHRRKEEAAYERAAWVAAAIINHMPTFSKIGRASCRERVQILESAVRIQRRRGG